MPTYELRFTGRFVIAQPTDTGGTARGFVRLLALNMQFNGDVIADTHRFRLIAPRARVLPNGGRRPDQVLVTSVADKTTAEQLLWDLDGYDVSFNAVGDTFAWTDRKTIAPLNLLVQEVGGSGVFDKGFLNPADPRKLVTGMVVVRSGTGLAEQFVDREVNYVKIAAPGKSVIPPLVQPPPPDPPFVKIADLVRITLTLPSTQPLLHVTLTPRAGGPKSTIVLKEKGGATVLTFSNLCNQQTRPFDEEFAGLYEVFTDPPILRDRLVPESRVPLAGLEDCYPKGIVDHPEGA